jgi:hypothetical protein
MEILQSVGFVIALFAWNIWITRRHWLTKEFKRNEEVDAPSEQQLRWDIRHLREDVSIMLLTNNMLLLLIAIAVILK